MKTLELIVPCYNEEKTLENLIKSKIVPLREQCQKLLSISLKVIILDDASKDSSAEIANNLTTEFDWIQLVKHEKNLGKGAAIKTGLLHSQADFVGIQDADEEYNPEDYLKLLEPILNGKADVVYGSRYLRPNSRRILSFWHTLMNKFLTFVSNMFTGLDLSDMETCYKLFTKKVIAEIAPKLKEKRFGFEPEITAYVAQGKYRVYECAIEYTPRTYDEGKKITYKDGFHALYCILHYCAPYAPIPMQFLLYTFIGGICALANFVLFALLICMHLSLFYAVLVAFVCVAVLNYYLCTALLFKHKAFWNSSMEVVMYMITLIIMGGLDFSVTYLWILIGGGQLTAKLIACVVGLIGNFVLRKYLVFPIRHFRKSKI